MQIRKYAVIGHPIGHSLSPFIHEKLFEIDKIDATYEALDIEDLDKSYEDVLRTLDGYNVTIPHKQNIIGKLDAISDKAALCSSVNTVSNTDKATGYTTDGYGFIAAVRAHNDGVIPSDTLIYGYGGAARAIAFELISNGCDVSFAVRDKSIAGALALSEEIKQKTGAHTLVYPLSKADEIKSVSLLVNATPVGMYPHCDGCVATDDIIRKSQVVFDSVYNPLETVLLKKAVQYGKRAIGSIDMLVHQAARAHFIWVGAQYSNEQLQHIIDLTTDKLRGRDAK